SKAPSIGLDKYTYSETRYKMLLKAMPDRARELLRLAQEDIRARWHLYEQLAELRTDGKPGAPAAAPAPPPAAAPPAAAGPRPPPPPRRPAPAGRPPAPPGRPRRHKRR